LIISPPLRSILVTGASSQIGRFLLPRLVAGGYSVKAISRYPADTLIDVAPLRLLPGFLPEIERWEVRLATVNSTRL
jgi:nucleoside-diphosphate-sugar epimerase